VELDVDGNAEHSSCITAVPMEWLRTFCHPAKLIARPARIKKFPLTLPGGELGCALVVCRGSGFGGLSAAWCEPVAGRWWTGCWLVGDFGLWLCERIGVWMLGLLRRFALRGVLGGLLWPFGWLVEVLLDGYAEHFAD
jgi:hypothetical protein